MKRFFAWVASGFGFAFGIALFVAAYNEFLSSPDEKENRELHKADLVGVFEIVKLNPTRSEDRLAFNALVKNSSDHYFSHAWLRVELFGKDDYFINSCDATTSDFEPHGERWVQIKCSMPGYNYSPIYEATTYGIMTATIFPPRSEEKLPEIQIKAE